MPGTSEVPRITFVDLLALETLENDGKENEVTPRFMSRYSAPNLGGGGGYGGHVYAQSVWAAAQTVSEGMFIHNVHGYFTLPVYTDRPLFYSVQTLSSGRSYCTRFVTVYQPSESCSFPFQARIANQNLGKICFASICSFKKDEPSSTKHQLKANFKEKYGDVLKDDPGEYNLAPKIDSPWWRTFAEQNPHLFVDDFPGLDIRKVDMSRYNDSKAPEDWRQLSYYRTIGEIPTDQPNLHACAHLYASDRNSLFLISNAGGFGDEISAMGSLSHSVILHVGSKDLLIGPNDWWCQEASTSRSEGGRGMHESRLWDSKGVLIGSTWQDGLVRRAEAQSAKQQRLTWLEMMRRVGLIDENTKISKTSKL